MYALPDLSYFCIPEFMNRMENRGVLSYSMLLFDQNTRGWAELFPPYSDDLFQELHKLSGQAHDIFAPCYLSDSVVHENFDHIRKYVFDAGERITRFLEDTGFNSVEIQEFMIDCEDWLSQLFASPEHQAKAAHLAARTAGIGPNELPAIISWLGMTRNEIAVILPRVFHDGENAQRIYKIYQALIDASMRVGQARTASISAFRNELLNNDRGFAEEHFVGGNKGVTFHYLKKTVRELLIEIGRAYAAQFQEAISNFELAARLTGPEKSIIEYASRTYREIRQMLQRYGFEKLRDVGPHEWWEHRKSRLGISVPRHRKLSPFVVKSITGKIAQVMV